MNNNIKYLSWFNFLLSFRFYFPVLIIYFADVTGSYALGTSIFSITMLSSALLEIPTGVFSDTLGRKRTLVLGGLATLFCVIFYAIGSYYWILALGAIFEGLGRALFSGNNQALLYDTLAEEKKQSDYSEFYGRIGSAEHLGLVISALLGGLIANWSFPLAMWLSIIPAALGFWFSLKIREPEVFKKKDGNIYSHIRIAYKGFITNKKLRKLSLSSIIGFGQAEASFQFRPAFIGMLWPTWAIGVAHALSNVGATVSYYFSGKLVRKFGALRILVIGKLYGLVSNVIAFTFPSVLSPAILVTNSAFFGSGQTSKSELMQREYSNEQRSTMESLNSLGGSLFFAVVSLVLGIWADAVGPATALLALQVLAGLSFYILWDIFRKEKN